MNNMRQMALAALAYANSNDGRFPESLELIVGIAEFGPRQLVCPLSHRELPPDGSPKQIIDTVIRDGNGSYVYLGRGMTTALTSDHLLAIEQPGNHRRGAMAVFADAHVELLNQALVDRIFNQIATGRLPVMPVELLDRPVK